jgi:folate-binding protein YgfZ
MKPTSDTLEQVRAARERGVVAALNGADNATWMANPGALKISGPDAARFLHAQTTNDVEGLAPGSGNLNARVTRTGHLLQLFSLHRHPGEPADVPNFVAIVERDRLETLRQAFDDFLFTDDLTLTDISATRKWWTLQGPSAPKVMDQTFPQEDRWEDVPENAWVQAGDAWIIRRSLTGDAGFLVGLPSENANFSAGLEAAAEHGLTLVADQDVSALLEVLRIEGGLVRVDVDLPAKQRLLPETGLEQQTVSYTKGCYLGQEVIARVRTYGSVPTALRALVIDTETPDEALNAIPANGEEVRLEGKRIGHWASRTFSPAVSAPVAYAYLDRNHRTPGTQLTVEGVNGPLNVSVQLLPLHHSADLAARVEQLYDRAIRIFADGDAAAAMQLLERTLSLDASFADAYEVIGVILGRAGRYHEAIDFFQRLGEVAPDEPLVHTNLSLYYMKIGDKQTAEDHSALALQKSLATASDGDRSLAEIANEQLASRRLDAERKKRMFGQVLEFDPVDPIALFGIGSACAILLEWEEAASMLERASEADKNNSAVYLAWGKALEELSRSHEALTTYRSGMEVASRRGDLMPLKEMEHRVLLLSATRG